MNLRPLIERVSDLVVRLEGDVSVDVSGIEEDSRLLRPGQVFIARAGERADGRRFVGQAIDAGAAAILSDAEPVPEGRGVPWIQVRDVRRAAALLAWGFHQEPGERLKIDFVTGTNGKTSWTWLAEAMLKEAAIAIGVIGTVERRWGDTVESADMTTPDAPRLHALLGRMANEGVERVVMELSSHAIAQDRWFPIPFRIGVFTNASRDHVDYHDTVEAYHAVKAEAFSRVLASSSCIEGSVVNLDDPLGEQIALTAPTPVVGYSLDGTKAHAAVRVIAARYSMSGTELDIAYGDARFTVSSPLVGRFNGHNILAAVAYGLLLGLSLEQILRGIAAVTRIPGRLDGIIVDGQARVLIDYAHTPDALENVLQALRSVSDARLVVVFGAGGDRDRGKRPLMGAVAQANADIAIVTSDNPRSEEPDRIIDDILAGMTLDERVVVEPDRYAAIRVALHMLDGNTVVLIAGKGHETYQLIGDRVLDFDDRAIALDLLGLSDSGQTA